MHPTKKRNQRGFSALELIIVMAASGGLMIASLQIQNSIQTGMVESDARIEALASGSTILSRIESALRSSSLHFSPIREFDGVNPVLRDGVDNDSDGDIDELDEAFPSGQPLEEGKKVTGIWFQRIKDIDASQVPPKVIYEAPSYLYFKERQIDNAGPMTRLSSKESSQTTSTSTSTSSMITEPTTSSLSDRVRQGAILLSVGAGEVVIAKRVHSFYIIRNGRTLSLQLTLVRRKPDGTAELKTLHRDILPRNW